LALTPWTVEENVALEIHVVPSGYQAVDIKWPVEVLYLCNFDGANLQGSGKNGLSWDAARRAVREDH
jgi:hypothetical protein